MKSLLKTETKPTARIPEEHSLRTEEGKLCCLWTSFSELQCVRLCNGEISFCSVPAGDMMIMK